ncbi:zinc finger protein 808-like [Cydia splendana]|uniref:zinc finger protein 808-like n=1 Tax=Cydia splendana TaxID=1100963 RepID=UPI00300CC135
MDGIADGGMARVKPEPEWESDRVKEEAEFVDEEACVKEECEDSTDGCGVSGAAMLAGLYDDHEVKDELVLGPERPHQPVVNLVGNTPTLVSSAVVSGRRRSCSVRLERLLVDAERRTCRVGRRTYKLHATNPAPTPHVTTAIYKCHHCGKRLRNNSCDYQSNLKAHLQRHLMIHTGEKPHKCRYCDYRSRQRENLRTHESIHTVKRPYYLSVKTYTAKKWAGKTCRVNEASLPPT